MDETSAPKAGDVPNDTTAVDAAAADAAPRRGVSRTTLVVSVLIALIVAGVAGVAIGWKIEQERVKEDVANIRPIGTVTAVDGDSVTIELQTADGTRTYEITDRTTVEGTGEIEEGSNILIASWRGGDEGQLQANRIVVLADQGSENTSG